MGIKKLAAFFAVAMMCAIWTGCGAGEPVPSATATPTPPPKQGVEALGKEITVAAISDASDMASALFFEGVKREAENLGIHVTTVAAEDGFDGAVSDAVQDGADAIVACLTEKAAGYSALRTAADAGVAVSVFEMSKGDVPEGIAHIYYTPEDQVDMAFDAALTYPPHDTPVRLILLFESKETEAYGTYQKLFDQGKIYPKEIYIASEERDATPGEWLAEKLEGYVEGMLDGVFAENTALAIGAFDTLEALRRTDMEVFGVGVTPDVVARMQKSPEVFAQAVGENAPVAGVLTVRAALGILHGGDSVAQSMKPDLVSAADLGEDAAEALINLDGEQAALLNQDWMDALRAQYGKTP